MTVPAHATAPTSSSLSPVQFRRGPPVLTPCVRPWPGVTHHHDAQPRGVLLDILIQPVMFTVLIDSSGGAIAGDVIAYLPTIVLGPSSGMPWTRAPERGRDLR